MILPRYEQNNLHFKSHGTDGRGSLIRTGRVSIYLIADLFTTQEEKNKHDDCTDDAIKQTLTRLE